MQRRHNCSPAASFANCFMTPYLLKVHLQTFLFIPITQKCQILSCDTLVANERCVVIYQKSLILKGKCVRMSVSYMCLFGGGAIILFTCIMFYIINFLFWGFVFALFYFVLFDHVSFYVTILMFIFYYILGGGAVV